MKPIIEKFSTGEVRIERYTNLDKLHRLDGPAYIRYSKDGDVLVKNYNVNGQPHRTDGPALYTKTITKYLGKTKITETFRYMYNNKPHRMDGPAVIVIENDKIVYQEFFIDGRSVKTEEFIIINLNHVLKDFNLKIVANNRNTYTIYDTISSPYRVIKDCRFYDLEKELTILIGRSIV